MITFNIGGTNSSDGDQVLVAIERKCLTLYQIEGDEVLLRDFDSVSL